MRSPVARLLADHIRRSLGVWVLVVVTQNMQISALWAHQVADRIPILGAVIASLAFFATFDSPYSVMRTLPLPRREIALVRWWAGLGMPAMACLVAIVFSWLYNFNRNFPVPENTELWVPALGPIAVLAVLFVLPLPRLGPGRANLTLFVSVWGTLAVASLYGLPTHWMPQPLPLVLAAAAVALGILSFLRAQLGKSTELRRSPGLKPHGTWHPRTKPAARVHLSGWWVLLWQLLRSTLLLSLTGIVAATVLRRFFPGLDLILPMLFVSATGIAGSVIARRWLYAVRALQCLPIRSSRLAIVICTVMMAPGILACALTTAAHWLVPSWGVAVPVYVIAVFAIIPALLMPWRSVESSNELSTSISQWSPFLQIATWPLWVGSFASLALTQLMPTWFGALALLIAAVFAGVGYFTIRARLRAGYTLEAAVGPYAAE